LNEQGVPVNRQSKSGFWTANAVLHILRNPIYTGKARWRKRQWVKAKGGIKPKLKRTPERVITIDLPALVSQELFDRVQAKIASHQILRLSGAKHEYLLRQLVYCGTCGRRYLGAGSVYSCAARHCGKRMFGKDRDKRCTAPRMGREWLEDAIWDSCRDYIDNPDKLALEMAKKAARQPERDDSREIAAIERNLAKLNDRRRKMEDAFGDDTLTKEAYQRQMARIDAVAEPAKQKLERLREEQRSAEEMRRGSQEARSVLEKLQSKTDYTSLEKRKIVEALVDRIVVDPLPDESEYFEGWGRGDLLQIDFKFHYERPWRRNPPATAAETQAGAEALLLASGAMAPRGACGTGLLTRLATKLCEKRGLTSRGADAGPKNGART